MAGRRESVASLIPGSYSRNSRKPKSHLSIRERLARLVELYSIPYYCWYCSPARRNPTRRRKMPFEGVGRMDDSLCVGAMQARMQFYYAIRYRKKMTICHDPRRAHRRALWSILSDLASLFWCCFYARQVLCIYYWIGARGARTRGNKN